MLRCVRVCLLSASLLAVAAASHALTITLDATDSGWFDDGGNHTASNQNYAVGWTGSERLRDFFVFDVSGLPGGETVLAATLRAHNPEAGNPTNAWTDGYSSPDASEPYELHQVLLLAGGPATDQVGNVAVYNDLGDGPVYGSHTASAADNGVDVEIALNAAGVAALDAAVGKFVLGGLLTSLDHPPALVEELFFGNTDPPGEGPQTRQLIVVLTPEPGTGLLLALGLVAVSARRRASSR